MTTQSRSHFIWHELMTDDVPGALAFYGHVLGLTAEKFPSADGGDYHVLSAGGRGMGGAMPLRDGMTKAFWVGYLATGDVDADAARLEKAGGKVMRPAADIPHVGRFALVTDPQGAGFVLFNPTPPPGGAPPAATGRGAVGWCELLTSDAAAAFGFYAEQYGWEKGFAVDMGPMGTYQTFAITESSGGGMMNDPQKPARPRWRFVFNVESVSAAMARVTEKGGQVLNGPHEVPGGLWSAQCLDPRGAEFGMVGPAK